MNFLSLDSALGNVEGLKVSLDENKPVDKKQYTIFSKVNIIAHKSWSWPPTGLREIDNLCL